MKIPILLAVIFFSSAAVSCLGRDTLSSRIRELENSIHFLESSPPRSWMEVIFGIDDSGGDEYTGSDDENIETDKVKCAHSTVVEEIEHLAELSKCMNRTFSAEFVKKHTKKPKGSCGLTMLPEVPEELNKASIGEKVYDMTVKSYADALKEFNCGCMDGKVKDLVINEIGSSVTQEVAGNAAGVTAIAMVSVFTGGLGTVPAIAVYMGGKYTVGILGGQKAVEIYHQTKGKTAEQVKTEFEEGLKKSACETATGSWKVDGPVGPVSKGDEQQPAEIKKNTVSSTCSGTEFEKCMAKEEKTME